MLKDGSAATLKLLGVLFCVSPLQSQDVLTNVYDPKSDWGREHDVEILLEPQPSDSQGLLLTTVFPIFDPHSIWRSEDDVEVLREDEYRPMNWSEALKESYAQGLLYAGRREFNWIVAVEVQDEDREKWSIGNLITFRHVLTTCEAVSLWDYSKFDSPMQVRHSVLIDYGTPYLRGDYKPVKDPYGVDRFVPNYSGASGVRMSSTIVVHEKCMPHFLLYNLAVIELSIGIRPLSPIVGYMPVLEFEQQKLGEEEGPNMTSIMEHLTPCYIASYGKPYYNLRGPEKNIIEDFKVKYRVYYVEQQICLRALQEVHRSGDFDGRFLSLSLFFDVMNHKLWCFMPRKRVGSICDHDRGAPLVCNGFVYGIVVRGVKFRKCNNLVQFPVVVLQVTGYVEELYKLFVTGELTPYKEVSCCPRLYLHPPLVVAAVLIKFIIFHG